MSTEMKTAVRNNSDSGLDRKSDSECPKGWSIATLEDVSEIIRGVTFPSKDKKTLPEKGLQWYCNIT